MPGIKYLSDIYRKQGKDFLDKLFNKTVVVTEMLNGSSFSFEKSLADGEISFYKRDQLNPISKIDRILMKYYEAPIRYINNLPDEVQEEIPAGWRFGMEYFINTKPVSLTYDRLPKNNLVLTYITVKDEYGDTERTIVDKKELDYWAYRLGVEAPPIIFQGKMNPDQKVQIQEFLHVPFDTLSAKYGTNSFAKYVISVLNPELKKTTLNDDLDKPIEGIVFRFGPLDGQGDTAHAKLIDPVFAEINKDIQVQRASFFPNDIYGITVLEVMNFILENGLESFQFSGEDLEDRYISFICDVFEKFLDTYGEEYRGIDFEEPSFLKGEGFEANIDNIPSEKTKTLVEEEKSYEDLFKLILSAFRKLKKKPGGFFTSGAIQQFNILVREISEYLNSPVQIVESGIPTFEQFRRVNKTILLEEAEEPEEEEDVITDPHSSDNDEKELLSKIEGDLKKEIPEQEESSKKKVNLVIGKFQPFHNGNLKMIQRTKKENMYPVVLSVVKPREGSSKFFIPLDTIKKMMSSLQTEFPDLIEDIIYVGDDLLETSMKALGEKYDVLGITSTKEKFENYVLQKKALVRKNKISPEFHIYSTPDWSKSDEIREFINRKDFVNFKKNAPKAIVYFWEDFIKFA
jgi:nicotinamide mononucleotide adenylyltransferase